MATEVNMDPLLLCLATLTKIKNQPVSPEALICGLPFDPRERRQNLFSIGNSKANFSRAAENAGFKSALFKKRLHDIPPMMLPAILLLRQKKACILTAIDPTNQTAEIIYPELDETPVSVDFNSLEEEYLGFVFFLRKNFLGKQIQERISDAPQKAKWFLSTLLRFKGIYFNVLVASFFINIFVIAGPMFTMSVYDRVIPHNAVDTLWMLTIGIGAVYIFDLLLKFLRIYFLETAAKKSDIILSSLLFEQCLNMRLKDKPSSVGAFANSIKDFDNIRSFLSSSVVTAFIELPFAALFLFVIYSIHPYLLLPPLFAIGFALIYSILVNGGLKKIINKTQNAVAKRNGILIESLVHLETIKAFNASSSMQWLWEESTGDIAQKNIKSKMLSASISSLVAFFSQLSSVAVVVLGVFLIKQGELTMGGLIAVNILSGRTIAPMSQVISLITSFQQMRASLQYLDTFMETEVERPEHKNFVRRPRFQGAIEFKNCTFTYPGENKPALEDVNLKIQPGERVAIIGSVGSGKSTLGKLLLNFYDLDQGSIFIDGIDIQQIDPADLRHNFSYVPQDISLFTGTARDNITFKAPHADDGAILKAAAIGHVNAFSDIHPRGLEMQVGEGGGRLSGGQRQSIAIARAFLHKSPMILLDAPTNAMDYATETQVVKNIAKSTRGHTTVIITHKSSMVDIVDRIVVMEKGRVVLDGPKTKVMEQLGKAGKS
ncbi:MAG: type I secretion system permease/ATPase [Desulfobacterales bacterium]|nr:type I secretion system permease/ATPase [Desulfobacterales bacterium]